MEIDITQNPNFDEYDILIHKNVETTICHASKFVKFLQRILNSKPYFIIIKKNEKLEGVMPFFVKDSKYGKVVNSLPFFGSYGGLVSNQTEINKKIIETFNQYNKTNDILSSVIAVGPFSEIVSNYEKYFDYTIKENRRSQCLLLENKTEDAVWQEFEQRVRRAVRKGIKNEIKISKLIPNESNMSQFYQMHKIDMESKGGRVKPIEFFHNIKESFIPEKDYNIFCAKKDETEIAYLLVFYSNFYAEYYMPAYDSNLKHLQATSVILWESIKDAIKKGKKSYNFGGTWEGQDELFRFKRGWAASTMPYYYFIYGDLKRAQSAGIQEIKKNYENFYVFSYADIEKTKQP